ncbi:hypothetical protein [Calothrix sp. UHCC 0171]|uniref:hypothetical protein n=1 Tax=Calothrix sp. UHCC 0171 TaxID=3110245 RepID=UPI002B20F8DB|nr:hypothetical protein [Calothrix sp. UHCC 0171]MEA5574219.1 hypothetical protein [Calothrix sp. UHCC 0171]
MRLKSVRNLLITFIPSICILAIAVAVAAFSEVTMDRLTRDVVVIAEIHPLSGALSNLGILLWCVAASVCTFVAVAIRDKVPRSAFLFLLASALLSGWLLFDDLFLFHEDLASRYLGLSERVVICALGIFVSTYLVAFRKTILKTNYLLLIIAFGFLVSSVLVDVLLERFLWGIGHWTFLVEDGLKWLGISYWCSYQVNAAHQFLSYSYRMPNKDLELRY